MRGTAGKRPAPSAWALKSRRVAAQDKPPSCVPQGRVSPRKFGGDKEKFCQLFQKLRVVGRSLPVANALRRPNRQVRPEPYGPKGVARVLVPGGHRLGPTEPAGETRRSCLPLLPKKGGRMSPSWDSTKAVAPGLERSKGSSIEKIQVLCGFQNLTQGSRVPHS